MGAPQWIDVSKLPFTVMLLLEEIHISLFPRDWPDGHLGIALRHNRSVLDFLRARLRGDDAWLMELVEKAGETAETDPRGSEIEVMKRICDWLVYVHCPWEYDRQPFLDWDDRELLDLTDYRGKVVADIGSGTGRLLLPVMDRVKAAFAVEPVGSLREYMKVKFEAFSHRFFVMDGTITDIPLPDGTCHVVLSGHVFGDEPEAEMAEMERIAAPGGMVILCPGNSDVDNEAHEALVRGGYGWSVFHEPVDGDKRKYWKTVE